MSRACLKLLYIECVCACASVCARTCVERALARSSPHIVRPRGNGLASVVFAICAAVGERVFVAQKWTTPPNNNTVFEPISHLSPMAMVRLNVTWHHKALHYPATPKARSLALPMLDVLILTASPGWNRMTIVSDDTNVIHRPQNLM